MMDKDLSVLMPGYDAGLCINTDLHCHLVVVRGHMQLRTNGWLIHDQEVKEARCISSICFKMQKK